MKLFLKVSYVETFYEDFKELSSFPVTIGRDPHSQITLMGHEISRNHAEILERDGELYLKDNKSRTGLWNEGKSVSEIKITEGLQVRIGAAVLQFSFIQFPLEQTISFGHEEHKVHHEPLFKRIEDLLNSRLLLVLFFTLLALMYFVSPDLYRKGDYAKNLAFSLLTRSILVPFVLSLVIVFLRKLNRGDYAWNRSLCLAYILCIFGELSDLIYSSLCWFRGFEATWNSFVVSILMTSLLFFWWFLAVGKNASLKDRFLRAITLSTVVYVLVMGVDYLGTGYRSLYEIESCDSLTGWHWGEGENLSTVESFLAESAKELSK